jgi:threonine/homoserine/homoserine lactone efflux protein
MSFDRAVPFALFMFVMTVTPGPNNVMLLASGVNFGLRRTIPHMAGITVGLITLILAVGLGLGQVFQRSPAVQIAFQVCGSIYLIWLALRLARASGGADAAGRARPMSLTEATLYQWLNPKAWLMAVTAIATYAAAGAPWASLAMMAAIIAAVCPPGMVPWVLGGTALRGFLGNPQRLKQFNIVMAVLLLASLWPVVSDLLRAN